MIPELKEADFAAMRAVRKANAKPKVRTARQKFEHSRCQEANIRTRKIGRRGTADRRITVEFKRNGVEHRYHATKGWRRTLIALRA